MGERLFTHKLVFGWSEVLGIWPLYSYSCLPRSSEWIVNMSEKQAVINSSVM
jgi:hypothetical protein